MVSTNTIRSSRRKKAAAMAAAETVTDNSVTETNDAVEEISSTAQEVSIHQESIEKMSDSAENIVEETTKIKASATYGAIARTTTEADQVATSEAAAVVDEKATVHPVVVSFMAMAKKHVETILANKGNAKIANAVYNSQRMYLRTMVNLLANNEVAVVRDLLNAIFALVVENKVGVFDDMNRCIGLVKSPVLSADESRAFSRLQTLVCDLALSETRHAFAKNNVEWDALKEPFPAAQGTKLVTNLRAALNVK